MRQGAVTPKKRKNGTCNSQTHSKMLLSHFDCSCTWLSLPQDLSVNLIPWMRHHWCATNFSRQFDSHILELSSRVSVAPVTGKTLCLAPVTISTPGSYGIELVQHQQKPTHGDGGPNHVRPHQRIVRILTSKQEEWIKLCKTGEFGEIMKYLFMGII